MESLYRLQVLVDLADQLSGPISGPLRAIDSLKSRVAQADVALEQMGQGAQLAGVGAALTLPMMGATQQAIRFETAFADVAKVVDFPSPQGAQDFQNDLMRLSNQIPLTAVQLTDIAAAAGQAGIAFNELVPFTRDAAQMAVAFDITAMQAGQSMAVLRNIFGLTQEGVVGLGDSVNALSNQMASAAPDMLNVLQRVGGTGRAIGMTAEQIVNFTPYLHTGTVAGSGTVAHSQPNHIVASYPSLFDGGAVDVVVSVELTTQTPGPHEYGPTQRYRVALQINRDAL